MNVTKYTAATEYISLHNLFILLGFFFLNTRAFHSVIWQPRTSQFFKFKFKFKMFFIASITREHKVTTSMFKVRDRTKQTECIKMNCTQNTWAANNTLEGVHEFIHLQMIYRYIYIHVHTQDAAMHACMRTYAHACMHTHMKAWCMQAHSQAWTYKETLILQIYMLDKIYTCNIHG